jgi:cytochrome c biogenesis protein
MSTHRGSQAPDDSNTNNARLRAWHDYVPSVLFSMKFAIWIAVILAVASIAGVLVQEFFPVRDAQQAHRLSEILPGPVYQAFMLLQLADPFRAVWFKALLGTLGLSLGLCALKNFGPNMRQAVQLRPIREPRVLQQMPDASSIRHASPELFDTVVGWLRRRLYFGRVEHSEEQRVAALHQGGISRMGPVLLHIGILVLVLGGLATSIVGKKTFIWGSRGQTLAIEGSGYAIRIDDFQIDQNTLGQVKQYRSQVTVLQDGNEVHQQEIRVNHPLRFAGYNLYQSSYQSDPSRASELTLVIRPRLESDSGGHASGQAPDAAPPAGSIVHAQMETSYPVPGHEEYEFHVHRFFAHLKITANGPVNASREFVNPAAEIEITRDGKVVATQWAFLRYPAHARDELPFVVELRGAQPAMATGLEVNTNPGAPLVWLGFGLSTLGLLLSFLVRHRCIYLVARPSDRGWTLWIAGRGGRERIAFSSEFDRFVGRVFAEARRQRRAANRGDGKQQKPESQSELDATIGAGTP